MVAFTPDLLTKIQTIDDQHRELVKAINDVEGMGDKSYSKEETEKTLDFLSDYVAKHFKNEEALMREGGYEKYTWHCTWHDGYIAKVKALKEEYSKNGPSEEFTYILNEFVIKWIVKHIKTVDVALGKHLQEKGFK